MNMQIKEFAKLTGVTVRALHYYDEIGLMKPSSVDEQNGYRFYDERCLERMQEILFYRKLDFPLKEIRTILSSPEYNKKTALKGQKRLLILKKERLERLISALDDAMKGEKITMNAFDNSEFEAQREKYAAEAKKKWGETAAYKEFAEKNIQRNSRTQLFRVWKILCRNLRNVKTAEHLPTAKRRRPWLKNGRTLSLKISTPARKRYFLDLAKCTPVETGYLRSEVPILRCLYKKEHRFQMLFFQCKCIILLNHKSNFYIV